MGAGSAADLETYTAMIAFLAKLLNEVGEPYLYRVHIDGAERTTHMLLDPQAGVIVSTTSDGDVVGDMKLFLDNGELAPSTDAEQTDSGEGDAEISRAEFSRVAVHIRARWLETGEPPRMVTKTFGG